MNTNKKSNNGWILCPSKSFPGKFYYFNVINGETAWSLNELENNTLKKDSFAPKVLDKLNCYPEPNSPPVVDNDTQHSSTADVYYKLHSTCHRIMEPCTPQSNIFGHTLVPQHINSNPCIPNVLWTPVQLPTQTFVPNKLEIKKQMADRVTQTQEDKEETYVQTCGLPLSDRFHSYNKNNSNSNNFNNIFETVHTKDNFDEIDYIHKPCVDYNTFNISPNKESILEMKGKSFLKEPKLKKTLNLRDMRDSRLALLNDDRKSVIRTGSLEKTKGIKKIELDLLKGRQTKILDKSDLRLLLVAKKRLKLNEEASFTKKLFKGENTVKNCEKHVTFDLTPQSNEDLSTCGHIDTDTERTTESIPEVINIHMLRSLGKTEMTNDVWFIIVDLNILLNEFEYINNFVQEDETCRLVIPYAVLSKIKEISTFNCNDYRPVLAARNLIRWLANLPQHITLQESDQDIDISVSKAILNCCLKLIEWMHHVVLITTDPRLYANGIILDLHCYMLQQIKESEAHIQTLHSIKIHRGAKENKKRHLCSQKPYELQPFIFENNKGIKTEEINNNKIETNIPKNNVCDLSKLKRIVRNDIRNEKSESESRHLKINFDKNLDSNNFDRNTKFQHCTLNRFEKTYPNTQSMVNSSKEYKMKSFNIQKNPDTNSNEKIYQLLNIKKTIFNTDVSNGTDNTERLLHEVSMYENNGESMCSNDDSSTHYVLSIGHKAAKVKYEMCDFEEPKELLDDCLYEKLKIYYIKNKVMSDRIVLRADEWMCTFTQIMENFMLELLKESMSCTVHLYTIFEAADDVAKLFDDQPSVKIAAYGLSALYNLINPNGKLNAYINPNDVIKTIGCGKLLVETFKTIIPQSEWLIETETLLVYLLNCIENPESDPNPIEFIRAPTVSRYDIDEDVCAPKQIFRKKPSETLIYLKKHFPQWRTYSEESHDENRNYIKQIKGQNNSSNVVRTIGRHLNLLKINNCNEMTLDVTKREKEILNKSNKSKGATLKTMVVCNKPAYLNEKHKECDFLQLRDFPSIHENTFGDNIETNSGPRVVRKVDIIKASDDRLIKPIEKSTSSSDSILLTTNNSHEAHFYVNRGTNGLIRFNDIFDEISETFTDIAYHTEVNNSGTMNDKMSTNMQLLTSDGSNNDSGLGNENCHVYTLIKRFLVELSASLKIVYNFITNSVLAIRQTNVLEENRRIIYDRTDKTYNHISIIIDKLKRIIERDTDDSTIKSLLIKAGVDVAGDKRIGRYSQVAKKCLEQARLLQLTLKVLLSIISENDDPLTSISETDTNISYFNIFE